MYSSLRTVGNGQDVQEKYFHELLGVDRGEALRAGLAAGDQKKAVNAPCTSGRGLGAWGSGEEEPGQGGQGRRGSTTPRPRAGTVLGSGISDVQFLFCFVLITTVLRNYSHTIQFAH